MKATFRRDPGDLLAVGSVCYLLAYLWYLAAPGLDTPYRPYIIELGTIPVYALTAGLCWRSSRQPAIPPAIGRGWGWTGLAWASFGIGEILWAWVDLVRKTDPFPSIADVAYLGYYPLMFAGLLCFPTLEPDRIDRRKFWLDVSIVILAALMVGWYFVLGPLSRSLESPPFLWLMSLAYPAGDAILLLGITQALFKGPDPRCRRPLYLLVTGLIIGMLADLAYGHTLLNGGYRGGSWTDGLWPVSALAFGAGAWYQYRLTDFPVQPRFPPKRDGRPFSLLPYGAVAIGYGLLLFAAREAWGTPLVTIIFAAVGLTGLVVARQILVLRENAWLLAERSAQESRFRSLVQNSSDVVTLIGLDGTISYQSPSVPGMYGNPEESVVGRNIRDLVHPEDQEVFERFLGEIVRNPAARSLLEWRIPHRGGVWRPAEHLGVNLLNDPHVRAIVLQSRDVTQRRSLEDRLRQVQKMDAVGRLAGGVAHDFNNLLTAITTHADLALAELREPGPAREDLEQIQRATQRAAAVIRQLLTLGQKQVARTEVVDLNQLVGGMVGTLQGLLPRPIVLSWRPADALGSVELDPTQLEQVVLNLVVNARDAMPQGGSLTIETADTQLSTETARHQVGLLPGRYAVMEIADTGEGMDEEIQSHLFEPFFTTKPAGQGTGLGLSTVYGVVTAAGGQITVTSAPGKGTRVSIYLPCCIARAPVGAAVPRVPSPELTQGTETILVADDEDGIRIAARRILQNQGYEVIVASNGVEALRMAENFRGAIHLLVTDMVMPEMGGRELIERLSSARPEMKVLCMSGYVEDPEVMTGVSTIRAAFLSKPFTIRDLTEAVRSTLDREEPGTYDFAR